MKNGKLIIRESATAVTGKGMVTSGTKTGKIREVAVPPPVWSHILAELPTDADDLIFPGRNGNNLTLGQYRWVFDEAVRQLQRLAMDQRQAEIDAEELDEHGQPITPEFLQSRRMLCGTPRRAFSLRPGRTSRWCSGNWDTRLRL